MVDPFIFCFLGLCSFREIQSSVLFFPASTLATGIFISLSIFKKINVRNDIKMYVCNCSDLTVKTLALIGKIASCLPLRLKATVFPLCRRGNQRVGGGPFCDGAEGSQERLVLCGDLGRKVALPEAFADLRCASDQCRAPGAGAQVSGR